MRKHWVYEFELHIFHRFLVINPDVKMVVVFLLGNVVSEDEVSALATNIDVIDMLLTAIDRATKTRDHKDSGFHLTELLDGLASIARSEDNKKKILGNCGKC